MYKGQGGSGSINALVYVRGQKQDFDDWVTAGAQGWSFNEVLPYFKKIERHPLGDTQYHSSSGKLGITQMRKDAHPICANYLDAAQQAGFEINEDFNGAEFEGAGIYDANIRNGLRDSSNTGYLKQALTRPNLELWHYSSAEKVLLDQYNRATGLRVRKAGVLKTVRARREGILAAGAVDTPKLLQLSGIGDIALLSQHGISLKVHLPAVGQNLQDHLCVSFYYRANVKTLNDEFRSIWGKLKAGVNYLVRRRGPLALSVNQAGGFFRGYDQQDSPNLQIYFNPLSYQIPTDPNTRLVPEPYSGFIMCFNSCRPSSRGYIAIASNDPADALLIQPNYLSTDKDKDEVIEGVKLITKLMNMPALKAITEQQVQPTGDLTEVESSLSYFRENAGSIYHLCGSCAMGQDENLSVVDHRLRVHGVADLRIVDASIFPNITSGNINAQVMMVAEKGAHMIIEDNI